jgi:hypothetical protein
VHFLDSKKAMIYRVRQKKGTRLKQKIRLVSPVFRILPWGTKRNFLSVRAPFFGLCCMFFCYYKEKTIEGLSEKMISNGKICF